MATLQGGTFTRGKDGNLLSLSAVLIRFTPEKGGAAAEVTSSTQGRFGIELANGRYVAEAFQNKRITFTTAPGFVVIRNDRQTFNVIVDKPTVRGAIERKWKRFHGPSGVLGKPVAAETLSRNRSGAYQRFQHGAITHKRPNGDSNEGEAFATWGAIHAHWQKSGGLDGDLGFAKTDELVPPDKKGRFNHFEGGSIYWSPTTGAHIIKGAIFDLWSDMGWETSWLGYPTTDELATPAPKGYGRFNHFEGGSIYWTPVTGAIALPKTVFNKWASLGHERGELGFPVPRRWGRNLKAFGQNSINEHTWLFEGGAIFKTSGGSLQVVRHSQISAQSFDTGKWRKRGEIKRNDTWVIGAQGLTFHPGRNPRERRWFVTRSSQEQELLGSGAFVGTSVDRITKLDKHFDREFRRNDLRKSVGTDHAGDCDTWQDRIYVACQVPFAVAILDLDLNKVDQVKLKGNSAGVFPMGDDYLSWCAVNPCDGMLYTSDFNNVRQIYGFDPNRGYRWTKTIQLPHKVMRVQGGDFTSNGLLILASDKGSNASIRFYNSHSGQHLCTQKVLREEDSQEIEGVCFHPGVPYQKPTALHTIVIRGKVPRKAWIKHWEIPDDQLAKM